MFHRYDTAGGMNIATHDSIWRTVDHTHRLSTIGVEHKEVNEYKQKQNRRQFWDFHLNFATEEHKQDSKLSIIAKTLQQC